MFHFSRKALKQEALEGAGQTLEATVQRIDNILLSVEQASGNIYWKIIYCFDQPNKIEEYRSKLVERNPYISKCVITIDSTITSRLPRWTEPKKKKGIKIDKNKLVLLMKKLLIK